MSSHHFDPPAWARNPHVQTMWPALMRKKIELSVWSQRFELPDGDFVDLAWTRSLPLGRCKDPIVVLFHGLEGSMHSAYIQGMLSEIHARGWLGVLMHFRGCSGVSNRLPRFYHSGETEDARVVLRAIKEQHPDAPLFAVGYSLGGNVLAKYLGEEGEQGFLTAASVVSVPWRLRRAVDRIDGGGVAAIYQRYLLSPLKKKALLRQGLLEQDPSVIRGVRSLFGFDDLITGPLHGFDGAEDYYTKSSAIHYLKRVQTRLLVIHALDDPFMFPEVAPGKEEANENVELCIHPHGGHVGFVRGTPRAPEYWLEKRIPAWFEQIMERTKDA